jgi:hypothetical protein
MSDQGRFKNKYNREEAKPNRSLWDDIEKNLEAENKKRVAFWWWFPLGIFLLGLGAYWIVNSSMRKEMGGNTLQDQSVITENQNSGSNFRSQKQEENGPEMVADENQNQAKKENALQEKPFEKEIEPLVSETPSDKKSEKTAKEKLAAKELRQKEILLAKAESRPGDEENSHSVSTKGNVEAKSERAGKRKFIKALKSAGLLGSRKRENHKIAGSQTTKSAAHAEKAPVLDLSHNEKGHFQEPQLAANPFSADSSKINSVSENANKQADSTKSLSILSEAKPVAKPDSTLKKSAWSFHGLGGLFFANKIQELNRNASEPRQRNLGKNEFSIERLSFGFHGLISRKIWKSWHLGSGLGFSYLADKTVLAHRENRQGNPSSSLLEDGIEEINPGFVEIRRTTKNQVATLDLQLSLWSPQVFGPFGFRFGGVWSQPLLDHFQEQTGNQNLAKTTWFSGHSFGSFQAGIPVSFSLGRNSFLLEPQLLYPIQSVFDNGFGSRNRPVRWGFVVWVNF